MTASCLPAKTDIGDHDGTDHQPQDRCGLKLLASEDRQIDPASSCLLAKIGGEAAREWAGQQRVSSSLAVDGFSSQQRARPTSIRPYIASQHLRHIPPTRRPSCLPAKIDSPVSPSYPRVSLTTNDSPDLDSSLYRSVPIPRSPHLDPSLHQWISLTTTPSCSRELDTSLHQRARPPALEWISLTTTWHRSRSPHSAGADFVATAARQRAPSRAV